MQFIRRILLTTAALGGLLLPALPAAHADVGPRPPITTVEVKDPQSYLAMRDETVNVVIDGHKAHVTAFFHFALIKPAWRQTLAMRLGFPQLNADARLRNFKVKQRVYMRDSEPPAWDAVTDVKPQAGGSGPSKELQASWLTWPLTFLGHNGAPSRDDVDTQVDYDQDLTSSGGAWRYTYVLRSGAPWAEPIGKATVNVTVKNAKVVSSTPKGAVTKQNSLTWTMANFKPSQDVTVTVK